jgi:CheY-specific phosphatase CheX
MVNSIVQVDEVLSNILAKSTRDGLAMAGVTPTPIGVSRYVASSRFISAIVGLVGPTSGAIMFNASEAVCCYLAGRMLGETYEAVSPEVLDGTCEITNIIAGQTKAFLSQTEWKAERISCPSIVVGSSYFVSHYKGMESAAVEFELDEMPLINLDSRLFSVSMTLMKV